MTTSNSEPSKSIELAAEIVAAFVANNSLPISELPALIHSVHAALTGVRERFGERGAASGEERAGGVHPQVDHARLSCVP